MPQTAPAAPAPRLLATLPALVVPDVAAAVAHYRDVLGFRLPEDYADAEEFAIVDLAPGEGIHFKRGTPPAPGERRMGAYVRLGLEALGRTAAALSARGARIIWPVKDQPWGMRELGVEDPWGHVVRFGANLDGRQPEHAARVSPEVAVSDAAAAAAFCREKLGMQRYGSPDGFPHFSMVERDGVILHWAGAPPGPPVPVRNRARGGIWDVCIEAAGIEALAEELRAREVPVVRGPEVTDYGIRELEITGPEGCTICFGEEAMS